MVCFSIIKKTDYATMDISVLNLNSVIQLFERNKRMIYVVEGKKLKGIIGYTEIKKMKKTGELVINQGGTVIEEGDSEEIDAISLFEQHLNWLGIPVVNKKNEIVYEYIYSHRKYYEDVIIPEGEGVNYKKRDIPIVVSVTTHDERLRTVYLALKSLMCQTMKPDEIVLYLAKGSGDGELVNEEELSKCGVQIVRGLEDLKCHKKYYYALRDRKERIIISADDDKLYDNCFIENLYRKHCDYPEAVICNYGDRIKYEADKVCTYITWNDDRASIEPETQICIKSHAGVLYPLGEYRERLLDKDVFLRLSELNDDLWVTACLQEEGVKVFSLGDDRSKIIDGTQETALGQNSEETIRRNDNYVAALSNYFRRAFKPST